MNPSEKKGKSAQESVKDLDKLDTRVEPLEERRGGGEIASGGGPVLSIVLRCNALDGVGMQLLPAGGGATASGTTAGGTTAGGTTAGGTTAGGTTAGGTTAGGTTAGGIATRTGAGLIELFVDLRNLQSLELRVVSPEQLGARGAGTTAGGTTAGGTTAGGTTAGGTTAGGTTAGGTTAGGTTAGGSTAKKSL